MEALGTARLTEEIPVGRAVAAVVPREELTGLLDDPEAQPELMLRMLGDDDEEHTISMDWSRDDLEELLSLAGDNVYLQFDRDELSGAFDEVEAHGMRERALVFTVAAAAALGTGAGAQATVMPVDGGPGGGSAAPLSPLASSEQAAEGLQGASAASAGSSGQFLGVDTPSPADAILVGGVLITLAGATFAVRRSGTARPV